MIKTRSPKFAIAFAASFLAGTGCAAAESAPDSENGRYALSSTEDGVIRMDTRSGAVSTCSKNDSGWACYSIPDERAALDAEIGRLQAENENVKAELAKLKAQLALAAPSESKTEEALPKSDSLKKSEPRATEGERKLEIPLPSDHDMDRVMAFLERVWRRLIEMANRVQRDVSGKI